MWLTCADWVCRRERDAVCGLELVFVTLIVVDPLFDAFIDAVEVVGMDRVAVMCEEMVALVGMDRVAGIVLVEVRGGVKVGVTGVSQSAPSQWDLQAQVHAVRYVPDAISVPSE